jgi:hypothetical protein
MLWVYNFGRPKKSDMHSRGTDGGLLMQKDPIIEEVRRTRQEYAKKFGYNIRALAADLQKHEQQHPERLISLSTKHAGKEKTA